MLKGIVGALVLAITVGAAQCQAVMKPEDGFISTSKYTNAFFGFSMLLPDVNLQPLSRKSEAQEPFRHTLFRANTFKKVIQ